MYLSRIELSSRAVGEEAFWREVSRPYGAHQAVWKLLSRSPDQRRDFLFHQEGARERLGFLVLSATEPRADATGFWIVQSRPFAPVLKAGDRLGFKLRASPVVRRRPAGPERRRGVRHDVVMDALRRAHAGRDAAPDREVVARGAGLAWLHDQGRRAGFAIARNEAEVIGDDGLLERGRGTEAVRVDGYRQHRVGRRGETAIRYSTLDFEGVLEVRDPEALLAAVRAGFGPQKAFGCGLMLLRRT